MKSLVGIIGGLRKKERSHDVEQTRPKFSLSAGSVQRHELGAIQRAIDAANKINGPIVEIGALFGMTTIKLAKWKLPDKKILAVDNFAWNPLGLSPIEHQELTRGVLGFLLDRGDVEIVVSGKDEFFQSYKETPPSMVFVDAIHSYEETLRDIENAKRIGARIIAGHDYSEEFPGVVQAVNESGGPAELTGSVWLLQSV